MKNLCWWAAVNADVPARDLHPLWICRETWTEVATYWSIEPPRNSLAIADCCNIFSITVLVLFVVCHENALVRILLRQIPHYSRATRDAAHLETNAANEAIAKIPVLRMAIQAMVNHCPT